MSKWEEKRLGKVAPFKYGKSMTADKRIFGKFNVFSSAGICGRSELSLAEEGIIIGRKGSVGTVYYSDKPFFCIDTAFYIDEIDPQYNMKFLYYYMKLLHLENYNNDAAVPGLNRNLAEKLKILCPDLPTQKRIADILSAYDDLIEANNRRIELLEKSAQELYKEWFVRFRFPGHVKTKFENGLPDRWTLKRIGELFDITSSKRVYLADYVEDGIPFYRSKEIIQLSQGQAITEPHYISRKAYDNYRNKFGAPEENDILITSVGTIGISYLADGHEFYFKDGNLTWIKSASNRMLALFLFQWLNSQEGKQQLLQSTIGTSQRALTIENLKKIRLLIPNNERIESYYNSTYAMIKKKRALQLENQNLVAQRDMLLPRLMSGKLEV